MSREEERASGGRNGSFFGGAFVGVLEMLARTWMEAAGDTRGVH